MKRRRRLFLYGYRAMGIMSACPAICEQIQLELCPAIIFFSALKEIDDTSQVVPVDVRDRALRLTVERLHASDVDFKSQLAKMTEQLSASVYAGDMDFVTPLALLKASKAYDCGALEAAFDAVGMPLEGLVKRIECDVPAAKLTDEAPPIALLKPRKYVVIVEGPDLRDEHNRYATLREANFAAAMLEATLKGTPLNYSGAHPSILIYKTAEFKKATRVSVERLQK